MSSEKVWRGIHSALVLALIAMGVARFSPLALTMHPNVDEETGIAEAIDYSYKELLLTGPQSEFNASPLHYMLDKAWIGVAEGLGPPMKSSKAPLIPPVGKPHAR